MSSFPTALIHAARIVMGAIFVVMGLNGFFNFLAVPERGAAAEQFFEALHATEFFWPLEKFLEIAFGVCLLLNRYVPLAVEGLLPIIVNIMLFHLFLDLAGIGLALIVMVCEVILLLHFWKDHFARMFCATC